ncbi:MAG: hypothetical protein FWG11_09415, partial [Promicromonosporaceae bacterium]|nr:hypothetical protein [Promicromonosporaceae bacterium]
MRRKIVLIGAGSAVFTQGLVMDLITRKWDDDWDLWLVDIEPTVLAAVTRLCTKMLGDKGVTSVRIFSTPERREALPGADFVVTTIGVGGRRAWEQDVFIPRKYGIYQPVGDTVGPGGISRSLRMIPAMIDIARDVAELCPGAYLFNYSNPQTTICTAVPLVTGVPLIGLCHGVKNGLRRMARLAHLAEDQVTGRAVGVNHFVVVYQYYLDGKDAFPAVREAIEQIEAGTYVGEHESGPISRQFFRLYGGYPVSDDRHYAEFTQAYFGEGAYFGKTLGVDAYSLEETIEHGDQVYADTFALGNSPDPLPDSFYRRFGGEHEELIAIIDSILHDRNRLYHVNIPNNGAVDCLPTGAVIEMPAIAGASGFTTMRLDDFPAKFGGLLAKHLSIADLTVEAALHGNLEAFEEAVFQGGYLNDRSVIAE